LVEAERFEQAYGAVWAAFHRANADDGLGQLERQVLDHVTGETTPSLIATHLGLARSTTTVVLKRLEAKGLVRRRRSAADERRVLVSRTPAGEQLIEKSSFLHLPELAAALDGFTARERHQLITTLQRLANSAQDNNHGKVDQR
jgi:DNA-binding MarR family transcriptional regulator